MTTVPTLKMNTGAEIPQLGFGVWQVPADETADVVTTALETGYRLIDTAQGYENEQGVGDALKNSNIPRSELFVTTKLANGNQGVDNAMRAFDESMKKLQLETVDLFLIHWPQPMFDEYVETWKVLEKIRAEGRASAIGVSNFNEEHLQRLFDETETVPAVNQIELHPGFTQEGLRNFNAKNGVLTEAWSPIGQGGKVLTDDDIVRIADAKSKSPAQLIIRWHMQLGNVAIPKSVTPERIRQNFEVFDFSLDDIEMATISNVKGERMGPDPLTFDMR